MPYFIERDKMKITLELKGKHKGMDYFVIFIDREMYGKSPFESFYEFEKHRCGYVKVPEKHPFYEKHYDWIHENYDVEVHGGLTYSEKKIGSCNDSGWFIGFDCAHYGDTIERCTEYYVKRECINLINQMKGIK